MHLTPDPSRHFLSTWALREHCRLKGRWSILHSPLCCSQRVRTPKQHFLNSYSQGELEYKLDIVNIEKIAKRDLLSAKNRIRLPIKKRKRSSQITRQANGPNVQKRGQENLPSHRVNEVALQDEDSQGSLEIQYHALLPAPTIITPPTHPLSHPQVFPLLSFSGSQDESVLDWTEACAAVVDGPV